MSINDIKLKSDIGVLALLSLRGVGPGSLDILLKYADTIGELKYKALDISDLRGAVKDVISSDYSLSEAVSHAEDIVEKCRKDDIEIIPFYSSKFPTNLINIPNRPGILYLKGTLLNSNKYIACVGTREPSEFGEKVAQSLSSYFAEKSWSIVSGLALGIDSLSHEGALSSSGHTVAILANGLDSVYPKSNERLADSILSSGGALISEQPPGIKVHPRNLVMRDRLQSGMSCATCVLQTGVRGGTMHTVEFSLIQGRKIYCPVPAGKHREHDKSQGINLLLNERVRYFLEAIKKKPELVKKVDLNRIDDFVARPIRSNEDYKEVLLEIEKESIKLQDNVELLSKQKEVQLKLM